MGRGRTRTDRHIEVTQSGYRAHIRISGVLHRKRFRKDTPISVVREWLLSVETTHRLRTTTKTGHFDDDARAYLEAVKAMPTFADRQKHIHEWIAVFGERWRSTITSDEITTQLSKWRSEPRTVTLTRRGSSTTPKTRTLVLSASAVNKRRTALMHLYSVLDGKAATNPVKDTPKFREPAPLPRALPYSAIAQLWTVMGDTPTRARLMMLAYVGLPHAQIAQLKPEHVDLAAKTIVVHGRQKGRGTSASVRPLTPEGIRAVKAMKRTDAWGAFSRSSMHKAFRLACSKVKALKAVADTLTPYDLRHSFGTEVYRSSGDIRATQVLMGHSSERLTHRYTMAAVDPRITAALKRFGKT